MIRTHQLSIVMAILIAALIAIAASAYYATSRVDSLIDRADQSYEQINALRALPTLLDTYLFRFMSSPTLVTADTVAREFDSEINIQLGVIKQIEIMGAPTGVDSLIGRIQRSAAAISGTLNAINDGNPNAYARLDDSREDFSALVNEGLNFQAERIRDTRQQIALLKRNVLIIAIVIPLLALIAVLLIGVPTVIAISQRVSQLNEGLRSIGRGAFGIRLKPRGNDALTELEQTVNEMASQLESVDDAVKSQTHQLKQTIEVHSADLAAANSRLRSIDDNRREFIIDLAHSLKTPLAVSKASIETSLLSASSNEKPTLERSLKAIDDVISKTESLLRSAQLGDGLVGANYTDVELYELLDSRVGGFRKLPRIAKLSLVYQGSDPLLVRGSQSELEALFDALIENAIQHTERAGNVEVIAKLTKNTVVVEIIDDGVGIADEDRDRVFERYYSSRDGGTGIGLSLAKRIVIEHGGAIEIESASSGGAKIIVELPYAKGDN